MTDELTMARTGLLDALGALESHLDALVIIGAQAVYLHTGATEIALAELTTDGDVAIDPDLLSSDPLVEEAMRAAGFAPDPRPSAIGSWISPRGVPVDLMVPDAVAGAGRRGVRVPPARPEVDAEGARHRGGVDRQLKDGHPGARSCRRPSGVRGVRGWAGSAAGGQAAQDPRPA